DSEDMSLKFWRPDSAVPEKQIALAGVARANVPLAFSGMSPKQDYFFATDSTGLIDVWKAETGQLLGSVKGPAPPIRNAVLSPQGKQIAVCTERENVARL